MDRLPNTYMKQDQTIIKSFEFQLKVTLKIQQLHLLLFHRLSNKYFRRSYNNNSIPYLVSSLYGNTAGLFKQLEEVGEQQSQSALSQHFSFKPPKLSMMSSVCGGQKRVIIEFDLQQLSNQQNEGLLRDKLSILESTERILSRKWDRLHQTTLQQQKTQQLLIQKLKQVSSIQLQLSNIQQQKLNHLSYIQSIIQLKKQELSKITAIYSQYDLNDERSLKGSNSTQNTIDLTTEHELLIEMTAENVIKMKGDLAIGRQKLVSRQFISLQTQFTLTIRIINLNFGIIIGVSNTFQLAKVSFQSANCIALSSQTHSINISGNHFYLRSQLKTKPNDILSMLVDRINHKMMITNNGEIVVQMQIAGKLNQEPLYPFLCLSAGDEVEIISSKQVSISQQ